MKRTLLGGVAGSLLFALVAVAQAQAPIPLPKIPLPDEPAETAPKEPPAPAVGSAGFIEAPPEPTQTLTVEPAKALPAAPALRLPPAPKQMPPAPQPLPPPARNLTIDASKLPAAPIVAPPARILDTSVPAEPKKTPSAPEILTPPTRILEIGPAIEPVSAANNERGLSIGVGLYYIKPNWESNLAYTLNTTAIFGANQVSVAQNIDFEYPTDIAPRVLVAYEGCTLGVRAAWWHYDRSSRVQAVNSFANNQFTNIFGPGNTPGTLSNFSPDGFGALQANQADLLVFDNRAVVDVWDFDITGRLIDNNCWTVLVGAGIRYNYISQYYDGVTNRIGLTALEKNSREVHIRNHLNLVGPDAFIEGRRSFSRFGLAVYGNARGGYLFGKGRYEQFALSIFRPDPNPLFVSRSDNVHRNMSALPYLETEVGLEWTGRESRRFQPFLRVGIVSQTWFGLGSALTVAGNSNTNGNFGFFGGTLLGGFNF